MLEINLIITDCTTLNDLRAFVELTKNEPADTEIVHHDMHAEIDGVTVVMHPDRPMIGREESVPNENPQY